MADPNVATNLASKRKRGLPRPPASALKGIRARSKAKYGKNPSNAAVLATYRRNTERLSAGSKRTPPGAAVSAAAHARNAARKAGGSPGPTPLMPGQLVGLKQGGGAPRPTGTGTPGAGRKIGLGLANKMGEPRPTGTVGVPGAPGWRPRPGGAGGGFVAANFGRLSGPQSTGADLPGGRPGRIVPSGTGLPKPPRPSRKPPR